MAPYRVLITTSGTGSRLGALTRYKNKSLISIGSKLAISHIIDLYPQDTKFVITLGYRGKSVQRTLLKLYPKHSFSFISVSPYKGPGSSLGYSMLQSKPFLQAPFIFHACDTLIQECPPLPSHNWVGGCCVENPFSYRTLGIEKDQLKIIYDKGVTPSSIAHIGLVGIFDFSCFWKYLQQAYKSNPFNSALNDTDAINGMLRFGQSFSVFPLQKWYDTGNLEELNRTRQFLF